MVTTAESRWYEPVSTALERARLDLVSRMPAEGYPLSLSVRQLTVVDRPGPTEWSTDWTTIRISGLNDPLLVYTQMLPTVLHGALLPLAELLDSETNLSQRPSTISVPNLSPPYTLLTRFLFSFAERYLQSLESLDEPDESLVVELTEQLSQLIDREAGLIAERVLLSGVVPAGRWSYRDVEVRPLSNDERGRFVSERMSKWRGVANEDAEFFGTGFIGGPPRAQLLTRVEGDPMTLDAPGLVNRVALAFLLSGYNVGSPGKVMRGRYPTWASGGWTFLPFALAETNSGEQRELAESEFRDVVDLAHSMPPFGTLEDRGIAIVLSRLLRGLGDSRDESGFLDLAIALEAALLSDERELSYKFRLYGALFLRQTHDPGETFKKLKRVYGVRSALVHGSTVKQNELAVATRDARELSSSLALTALRSGWPNPDTLDHLAIGVELPHPS